MKRIVWGIIVCVAGLLCMAGAPNNPNGPLPSVVAGLMLLVGGGLLFFFGLQPRTLERMGGHAALSLRQPLGYVPCEYVSPSTVVGDEH